MLVFRPLDISLPISFSRGCLGEGVDSPSEGVDTILEVRGWTLFLVRVENLFSDLGPADV